MVAEVIINTIAKELNKTYDYIIPDSILNQIKYKIRGQYINKRKCRTSKTNV